MSETEVTVPVFPVELRQAVLEYRVASHVDFVAAERRLVAKLLAWREAERKDAFEDGVQAAADLHREILRGLRVRLREALDTITGVLA